jgi:hypothetical protein
MPKKIKYCMIVINTEAGGLFSPPASVLISAFFDKG